MALLIFSRRNDIVLYAFNNVIYPSVCIAWYNVSVTSLSSTEATAKHCYKGLILILLKCIIFPSPSLVNCYIATGIYDNGGAIACDSKQDELAMIHRSALPQSCH